MVKFLLNEKLVKEFETINQAQKFFINHFMDLRTLRVLECKKEEVFPSKFYKLYNYVDSEDDTLITHIEGLLKREHDIFRFVLKILASEKLYILSPKLLNSYTIAVLCRYNGKESLIVYMDDKFYSVGKNKLIGKIANLNYKMKKRDTNIYKID